MSVPYSRLLAAGAGDQTDDPVEYTPPAGKVWIVRDIDAYSNASLAEANLFVKDTENDAPFAYLTVAVGSQNVAEWRGRQVFAYPASITIESDSGSWQWRVSGYELDDA